MPSRRKPPPPPPADETFVAIDFETADYGQDSACAVGLVRVERRQVVRRETVLIRPPRSRFVFSYLHGITWPMVSARPVFAEVWPLLCPMLEGASFVAAHNASFDRGVLATCCSIAGLSMPDLEFVCTVQLARRRWGLKPNDLPSVCRRLGIELIHHEAGSDAEACARIVIAATEGSDTPPAKATATSEGASHVQLRYVGSEPHPTKARVRSRK